jgi:hypothetical protein
MAFRRIPASVCASSLLVVCTAAFAQDDVVIAPLHLFEARPNHGSWALECSASAGRYQHEGVWTTRLVGLWMRWPVQSSYGGSHVIRRAYSDDGGTTWALDDMHHPDDSPEQTNPYFTEFDPTTAFDPVTGTLYAGGFGFVGSQTEEDFITRRTPSESAFTQGEVMFGHTEQAHFPQAAAGPKAGQVENSRIYVKVGSGLRWSDDLGETWEPTTPLSLVAGFPVVRIGNGGQLYLSDLSSTAGDIHLARSAALDGSEAPVFLGESEIATITTGFTGDWFPGLFGVLQRACIAVAPHDGNRVYAVWPDKTSDDGEGNTNVDLYFTMTTNAVATTVAWDSDPTNIGADAPRIIPSGVELAGDQFFPCLEATTYRDTQGNTKTRLHLLFMDTRHNTSIPDSSSDTECLLDMYYLWSDDEGATWNQHRLTTQSMDWTLATEQSNTWIGEYIGLGVAGKRVFPFFPVATSIYTGFEAPRGYSEPYTAVITFGDIASTIDLTAVEGTVSGSDDVSLISSSNDQRLVIGDTSATNGVFKTIVDDEFDTEYTGANADDEIDIRVECHAAEANVNGRILLKNQNTGGTFEEWLAFDVPQSTDGNTWKRLIPAIKVEGVVIKDYISSTGRIDVRLEMMRETTPTPDGLISRYDFVQVQVIDN